jgi:hypothetical protein
MLLPLDNGRILDTRISSSGGTRRRRRRRRRR